MKKNQNEKLTALLVKKFVDDDLGLPEKKATKKRVALEKATPANALKALLEDTRKHRKFFESTHEEFWTEAEKASPGIVTRLTTELDLLVSYLRS